MKKNLVTMGMALFLSLASVASANTERPKDAQGVHDGVATGCAFSANHANVNSSDHCKKCVESAAVHKDQKLTEYMFHKCVNESSKKVK
jgi:hypothetical protein